MSEKPLAERLQVKSDRLLAVIGATPELDAAVGASDKRAAADVADVVLVFVRNDAELRTQLERSSRELRSAAILWLAYPKLSSKLAGDLSRDLIREIALTYALETVSQIAVDETWSALRLKRAG